MRALLVLAAVLSAGCASSRAHESLKQLQESLEAYNDAYRWKNYERAAGFMPADLRAAFLATYEDEETSLQIEDYQLLRVDMDGENAATAVVRVRYMLLPSVTVEKTTLVQHWHRVQGQWILESEENSIRELAVDKKPRNPNAFGPEEPPPESLGDTKVDVEGPGGNLLRDEIQEEDEEEPAEDD